MNRIIRCLCLVFIAVFAAAPARGATPDVNDLVKRIDSLYRSKTSYAELEMTIVTPNWERTLKMKIWTEGMKKTFVYISEPKKDAGIATLRNGTEMWNYFPKINKVMKVPPSMMMGAWMGSDFTNDDLVKESSLAEDYDAAFAPSTRDDAYEIALTPKANTPTVWGKILLTVRKTDLIPLEEAYYDEKDNKMRVMTFSDVKTFGGRTIPAVMEMVPLNKDGHKTIIRYLDARFDFKLPGDVFSLRNLRKPQ